MWLHHIKHRITLQLGENRKLQRALLLCAALLCANALLYVFLIVPAAGRLSQAEARYAELKKRRVEAVLFQKQKKELAGLLAGIPTQKDMPLLVKEFVQKARGAGLAVSSINYDIPTRGAEELALLTFSFPTEGKYADIKRFLYEVETSDRIVGIQEVKLDGDKGRVKLQMKLMTYIREH
jgi:Tfp pilus assembly protein PilO